MAIKSIVDAVCTCLTIISFNAYAVDDATIANIDSKASSANNKADGNNSRILDKALIWLWLERVFIILILINISEMHDV